MTSAQATSEFTKLRNLQRLLRFYQEQHGPVCGIPHLRRHVIDRMKRSAWDVIIMKGREDELSRQNRHRGRRVA